MSIFDIITIGSATRDGFFKTPEFKIIKDKKFRTGEAGCFVLGTKIAVPEVIFTTGGGSTNAAVGFARQGLKTACIARIGKDVSGEEIKSELEQEGVSDLLQTDKKYKTAYSAILVSQGGERTILEYRGANDFLTEKDINWKKLQSKWLFLDSLAGNTVLLKKSLNWAKENGVKVAFNPGKKLIKLGRKLWRFLSDIDIFIVNQDEAGFITGIGYKNEDKIFKKLDDIIKGVAVMTKGGKGVVVSDGNKIYKAGTPKSPVIDRTGAGDSFSSGFVAGFIRSGGDIPFSIQLGTANATSVVRYFGAKKGLLKKGDWGEWPKVKVQSQKILL